jgi:hypothetical protein
VNALYDMNGSYSPGTILGNLTWTAAPYSGQVTQVTGYKLVNSLADLESISLDLAGNYALGKDVDISAPSCCSPDVYVPIGKRAAPFTGQFDGMGHTLSNLNVQQGVSDSADPVYPQDTGGLFGEVGASGVVRNVSVIGFVKLAGLSTSSFGIAAGVNYGQLVRVRTSGRLSEESPLESTFTASGGLVGSNYGAIIRSSSDAATLSEGVAVGGLVGNNLFGGVILQSYAAESPSVTAASGLSTTSSIGHGFGAGGLVGHNDGRIVQSYATGSILYAGYCGVGGINCGGMASSALAMSNNGTIEQSFATGKVTQAGTPAYTLPPIGLAVYNAGTIANDVFWDKQTTGATLGVAFDHPVLGNPAPAGNGLTTAQMSTPSSFGVTYDFSANGVWAMPAGATHPVLRWQLEP